jgi:hypothetical protein
VVSLTSFVIVIHAVMCGTLYLKIKLRRSSIILSRAIFVRIASTASFTALTGITSLYINTIKAAAVIIIVYTATSVTA